MDDEIIETEHIKPQCLVFGQCGGCQYQNISYKSELALKEKYLQKLFSDAGILAAGLWDPIVPSPAEYHYRCRLDMKFLKTRDGRTFMGFSPLNGKWMIEVDACPIAMRSISDFLPQLKKEAILKLPPKYRNANLVVKTSDDGRVVWGGIGRRSLKLLPEDFLCAQIDGKKIFYSLDTFFQANLAILPLLMQKIRDLNILDEQTTFYDLYGGVGLFGICLSDLVGKVILIEDNIHSTRMAEYNKNFHGLKNFEIISGKVEDVYPQFLEKPKSARQLAMIDPPRQGLAPSVAEAMARAKTADALLYLSCHPESLVRDLKVFLQEDWRICKVMPFDFFARTQHIETLVLLKPAVSGMINN